jgi:hypothetical protein
MPTVALCVSEAQNGGKTPMAYLRDLSLCQFGGCSKVATVELCGIWNQVYGVFCKQHGKQKLNELLKIEEKAGER